MTVNLLFEEFCNIGTLGVDFLKQLAILRGFNINCQMLVQSVPQLVGRYPREEWEEIISHCDTMILLGANDLKTADYFSDKCGSVTIRVDNNQMPLMPLFSPVYHSTRPYSQTRTNTRRALMMPDEILRMDGGKSLVLLRGQKPIILSKITPEEFPVSEDIARVRITDYVPTWRSGPEAPPVGAVADAPDISAGRAEHAKGIGEPEDVSSMLKNWKEREIQLEINPPAPEKQEPDYTKNKYGALTPVEISPKEIRNSGQSF